MSRANEDAEVGAGVLLEAEDGVAVSIGFGFMGVGGGGVVSWSSWKLRVKNVSVPIRVEFTGTS